MLRLTEDEAAQWLADRDLPAWVTDEARGSVSCKWTGYYGETVAYDRGDGFYWVSERA